MNTNFEKKKILFISNVDYVSLDERNIYTDLLRQFVKNNYYVYAISPRQSCDNDEIYEYENCTIIKPLINNLQKSNYFKKGLSLLRINSRYIKVLNKYISSTNVDLILYATPPVNIVRTIDYARKKYNARTFLLLKDIWPDGIADLGAIKRNGLIYRYFRRLEKKLYKISDKIGCMSPANVKYVLEHNTDVSADKVEVCPNSIEVQDLRLSEVAKTEMRAKYNIPQDKEIFVYGGNLGKPQGIPFIIECLHTQETNPDVFFLIVGDGTEYHLLEDYVSNEKPSNVRLMQELPKDDYDHMIAACDVGMIFLDHRFTIPNFPSRLLSYMQAGLPVLACTDPNTDIGKVIEDGGYGWWCESYDSRNFVDIIQKIVSSDIRSKGYKALKYMHDHYSVEKAHEIISME